MQTLIAGPKKEGLAVPIYNPEAMRVPKVMTPQLAKLLGKSPITVRAWVRRGILPEPERLGPKTHLHDLAAVLSALASRIRFGEGGYVKRKAQAAARRAAREGAGPLPAPLPLAGQTDCLSDLTNSGAPVAQAGPANAPIVDVGQAQAS
jgi:hypothetical protein